MSLVHVVGSINQDVVVRIARSPRPGETLIGQSLNYYLGGKGANQAVAAQKLGARTRFVGMVGDDPFGRSLVNQMAQFGLGSHILIAPGANSGTAMILVDDEGQNSIAVILGANSLLSPSHVQLGDVQAGDVVLLQHEISLETNAAVVGQARAASARVIVNAAPALEYSPAQRTQLDILIVNQLELRRIFGQEGEVDCEPRVALSEVREKAESDKISIVLTLGSKGAVAFIDGREYVSPGISVRPVDTTGAGDCFTGAFAAALTSGLPYERCLEFANRAAALSVTRHGAAVSFPTRHEVAEFDGELSG